MEYRSPKFLEVPKRVPRTIPAVPAERVGAGAVSVKQVRGWVAKMTEMVDYDEEDLHYRLFKSPFERLPLVGCRPRLRKNAAKRTLRLVGSSNTKTGYIRLCEEAAFGDFHDDESDR